MSCLMQTACLLLVFLTTNCVLAKDHDDYLNTCIDAENHKDVPGPEPDLHGQCAPWRDRACCAVNTTKGFHAQDVWLGFTWNHCEGHMLSDSCRQWFLKDLCFYECSPNVGPWIIERPIRIRNERFTNVPFCASQCNSWWAACSTDFTCWNDWGKGFNYSTGVNTCPSGTVCRPFHTVWPSAENFCEHIWDHSFRVVPDDQPCFKIDYTGRNPNDAVANYYFQNHQGNIFG
ncbi:FOLR2-like protein [Mya arenaria]|uniref:FOLR2-like protein n=1 Tax=Mya arenaria TaxID=6604 RepID=A0ABY7D7P9_MYAAR|nr:folate receptor beta-like [Mya arenaria]WAQ93687.1 FOLR2-like protein [Mya arenaria]